MSKATRRLSTPSGTASSVNRRSLIAGIAASAASTTASAAPVSADAELLAMIERHDALWTLTDRLAALGDAGADTAEYADANEEAADLERWIAATPAFTPAGLAGKRRVVERAEFDDDYDIIATILRLDAARVHAAS
jgi:hypothetical protein